MRRRDRARAAPPRRRPLSDRGGPVPARGGGGADAARQRGDAARRRPAAASGAVRECARAETAPLDRPRDRQGEDRAVEAVAGFGEADVGLLRIPPAVKEDAAEAFVGAQEFVDAGADGEAHDVLVLDEDAETAGGVEELPALVQAEQGRLTILEEARAIGPVAARHVVAEVD